MDVRGRRVLILGLGAFGGGVAAARFCAQRGARVTITDLLPAERLTDSIQELADVPIAAWRLGEHREEDLRAADVVIVNPSVRPDSALVDVARRAGAVISSELELLLDHCPAPIVAVTGSNGKSTTATMIFMALVRSGRRAWLGGNIGHSLLADLDAMTADDVAVVEMSSFQLHWLSQAGRPIADLAVVTNCTPNHLDWHPNWRHYVAAKQRLVQGPRAADRVVLNPEDATSWSWRHGLLGELLPLIDDAAVPPLHIAGAHARQIARLAAAAALACGATADGIATALAAFPGLPHRLQSIESPVDRHFVNDSKATTPEATLAALDALSGPLWLLLGGRAKGQDFGALAAAVAERVEGVVCYGECGPALAELIRQRALRGQVLQVDTLHEAFDAAWNGSRPGDTIVLSPACASTDQFRSYIERGLAFLRHASQAC